MKEKISVVLLVVVTISLIAIGILYNYTIGTEGIFVATRNLIMVLLIGLVAFPIGLIMGYGYVKLRERAFLREK